MARHKQQTGRQAGRIVKDALKAPETSQEWRLEQIKWREDGSHLINFGRIYFPHICCDKFGKPIPSPEFHAEIVEALSNNDRVALAAPRGFAKTTLISLLLPLYMIVTRDRDDIISRERQKRYILLLEATQDMAEESLADIRAELEENELLRADFGDMMGGGEWSQKKLDCSNGMKLRARGAGTAMRGLVKRGIRPDLIIADDVDGDDKAESRTECAKLRRWWNRAVTNLLGAEGGQILMVGTILHWDALLPHVMKKLRYFSRIYKGVQKYDEDGQIKETLWPEYWTAERLTEVLADIGSRAFEQEVQNNPVDPETQAFKDEVLAMVKFDGEPDDTLTAYSAIDPAIGEKSTNDYFVKLVARVTDDGRIWVFDGIRGRFPITRQVEIALEFQRRYGMNRMGVESIAYQKALAQLIASQGREERIYPRVKDLSIKELGRGSKYDKIESLVPLLEQGTIRISSRLKWLFEELETWPKSAHDDAVDCLQMLVKTIRPVGRASRYVGSGVRMQGSDVMRKDKETTPIGVRAASLIN